MIDLTDESDIWIQKISDVPLGDALSVDWQHQLRLRSESLALPAEFVSSLIQICIAEEPMQHNFVAVSFLELALWIVQILNGENQRWSMDLQNCPGFIFAANVGICGTEGAPGSHTWTQGLGIDRLSLCWFEQAMRWHHCSC